MQKGHAPRGIWMALAGILACAGCDADALSEADVDPVVFVHGCSTPPPAGFGSNEATAAGWRALYEAFRSQGYPAPAWTDPDAVPLVPGRGRFLNVMVYQGEVCPSNVDYAGQIRAYVRLVRQATGARKVDVVAYSMGGLATRWFLHELGGEAYVRDVVFLASPHHGTGVGLVTEPSSPLFESPAYDGAREMTPPYSCNGIDNPATSNYEPLQAELNGCGRDRHTYPRTGPVSYLNVYNPVADELIVPAQSACLNQAFPGDCTDDVNVGIQARAEGQTPHEAMRVDPRVIRRVYEHLTQRSYEEPGAR